MIQISHILLIGAGGRKSGKTLLACQIIKRYSPLRPLIGVKVTTIRGKDEGCPRGGEGCGACSSLEGVYCITEEKNSYSKKDTSRLLNAGARQVFWLRVLQEHLLTGMEALLELIPPDSAVVCESNSIRTIIEPGVFLMVKGKNLRTLKPSARDVQNLADRIIDFDPERLEDNPFNFDLDEIQLLDNKWVVYSKHQKQENA
jgi:hypothetical protein